MAALTNEEWETLYSAQKNASTAGLSGWQRFKFWELLEDGNNFYLGADMPPLLALVLTTDGKGLRWFDTTTQNYLDAPSNGDLEHLPDLPIS